MSTSETYRQELSRSLSLRENMLITLSSVTPASSVFIIVPALIAGLAGGSVLAMIIGGVIAIFVGLCYAELSSRFPITGGEYTWAARVLGRPAGFGVFLLALVGGVLIISVIASGVGPYLAVVWSGFDSPWTAVLVVAACTAIACLTITTNAWVTGVCLALEILACVALVILGFMHISRSPAVFFTPQAMGEGGTALTTVGWGVLFSLVPVALFAYNGYGGAVYYAEETKGATKTIGKVIMTSLLITVLAELVPLMAVILGTSDLGALSASATPMNDFLVERGGDTMNLLVSIGIAIAIFNAVIAIIIQIARLVYASARDRSWPDAMDRLLGSIHPSTKSPVAATVLVGVVAAIAGFAVPFNWLLIATGSGVVVMYVVVALSAIQARRLNLGRGGGYRMPLFPIAPAVVLIVMAYVVYLTVITDVAPLLVSLGAVVLGVAWYYGFIHPQRGTRWTLPDPSEED